VVGIGCRSRLQVAALGTGRYLSSSPVIGCISKGFQTHLSLETDVPTMVLIEEFSTNLMSFSMPFIPFQFFMR
jgi:hypothetical protein